MCRVAEAQFGAALTSAALARRWIDDRLRRWELTELTDTVTLLVTELVTNAVVHTGGDPKVRAAVAAGAVEVEVSDPDPAGPEPVHRSGDGVVPADQPRFGAEGGRGLWLVEALADEWGATRVPGGKRVWFRLLVPGWQHSADCCCERAGGDRTMLGSGRFVVHNPGSWDAPQPASP